MINIIVDEKSAFEIDEPDWQVDREHHCRRCGKIFCGSCCSAKLMLPRLCFVDPQRVCIDCVKIASKEIQFFDEQLPKLTNGGEFQLNNGSENHLIRCKVNPKTHRDLIFSNLKLTEDLESVVIQDIISFQCLTDPLRQTSDGKGQLVGVNMKYLSNGVNKEFILIMKS